MAYEQYKAWVDEARRKLSMFGEPALTAGSSAIAEPISGLAGLVTLPFAGADAAANNVKAMQEYLTYQPRTQAGMQGLQGLQAFLQPVGEVIQDASQNLGDKAYSATGSPALAAAAYSTPTALLEGLGLKGLNIARKPVSGADLYSARMGMGDIPDKYKENFDSWFSGSQAASPDGKPLVLYHGTSNEIDEFNIDHFGKTDQGWFGEGFYFADSPDDASNYAASFLPGGKRVDTGGNVVPVYLDIKNPLTWESGTELAKNLSELRKELGSKGFSDWLRGSGYDGVRFIGHEVPGFPKDLQWMALSPEQIKSAAGNSGQFSRKSKKISE